MHSAPARLPRRERERRMRRRDILSSARTVFAEKGFADATVEEIAHRAEYSKGTLYNYFSGGKEDVLFAIVDEFHGELLQLIRRAFPPDGSGFRDGFRALVTAWTTFFEERRDLFMIMVKEAHRSIFDDNPGRASYFRAHYLTLVEAFRPALRRAMEAGEIRTLGVDDVAHVVLGSLKSLQMQLCLHGGTAPHDPADFLTAVLCDGLLNLKSPHPCATESASV